jgi:hypothetical protein
LRHSYRPSGNSLVPCFVVGLLLSLTAAAVAAEPDAAGLRHWAFGWDPGMSASGLTVRYRPTPDWDLAVAAGPNDTRSDVDTARQVWDDGLETDTAQVTTAREESGWVRLSMGRRFWRQDRVSVSGVCSVYYTWSAREDRYREYNAVESPFPDYVNRRHHYDTDTWTLGLGIRPSVVLMPRLQVEFDAGLALTSGTEDNEYERWWDSAPGYEHEQQKVHNRSFRTFGGFATSSLKFIFWF